MIIKDLESKIEDINITEYECSDIGAGALFADLYGKYVKYVASEKSYFIYNEKSGALEKDTTELVVEEVKNLVSVYMPQMADEIENGAKKRTYSKWIKGLQSNAAIGNILKSARSIRNIATRIDEFDKKHEFLKLNNCVLNLSTLKLRKHKSSYLHTKGLNVTYDKRCSDETWKNFIMDIVDNDIEMYNYLLRSIAYALLGNPVHHCLFILHGQDTRNGKSTFAEGLLDFFGSYGASLLPNSLSKLRNSNADAPSPDLARLRSKRFISVSEPSKQLELNAALVKKLTGGDAIPVRHLHSEFFEMKLSGVFFIQTNHLPKVDDQTLFTSRRIIVIPFNKHFTEEMLDVNMPEKLKSESAKSGLLNLLLGVLRNGVDLNPKLNQPKMVTDKIREYMNASDPFKHFIKKYVLKINVSWISSNKIKSMFNQWAETNGEATMTSNAVTSALKAKGLEPCIRNGYTAFMLADLKQLYKVGKVRKL